MPEDDPSGERGCWGGAGGALGNLHALTTCSVWSFPGGGRSGTTPSPPVPTTYGEESLHPVATCIHYLNFLGFPVQISSTVVSPIAFGGAYGSLFKSNNSSSHSTQRCGGASSSPGEAWAWLGFQGELSEVDTVSSSFGGAVAMAAGCNERDVYSHQHGVAKRNFVSPN